MTKIDTARQRILLSGCRYSERPQGVDGNPAEE